MTHPLKLVTLLAALAAAPAFAQPDPHHPEAQAQAPAATAAPAAPATPAAKSDMGHGCPMADSHMAGGGHMMSGPGHMAGGQMMSGAGGMHCDQGHHAHKDAKRHTHHHRSHPATPKPAK